jgi:hypothetical protein
MPTAGLRPPQLALEDSDLLLQQIALIIVIPDGARIATSSDIGLSSSHSELVADGRRVFAQRGNRPEFPITSLERSAGASTAIGPPGVFPPARS